MSDVPTATKIAALEDHVLRLLAENVRLSNEAADVRKELEQYQDSLEVMTTDNNATFEGINAALDAADITFLDNDTYAACIGRLAAERDERNAYAERLLAENVRLTNEAAFMRGFINNEDVRSDFPNATAMRETLDSLRQSIYAACAGSGCLNAHELRAALDAARNELEQYRMRLAGALIASEGGDGQPSDALEYLRTCPTITSVMKLRAALDRERERCGVLEREVRARRAFYVAITADEQETTWFTMAGAAAETDTRHALDAATFVGGGSE